jgi:hypothetical protein
MRGLLYADHDHAVWVFLVITLLLGGSAAWATGRAIAKTWRPYSQTIVYAFVLAAAVHFLHFALFSEKLASLHFYLIGWLIVLGAASIGFRRMRVQQMLTQYSFAFERSGPFHWHARTSPEAATGSRL